MSMVMAINIKYKLSVINDLVKSENIDELKRRIVHDNFKIRLPFGAIVAHGCAMGKTELVDELLNAYPNINPGLDLIYFCIGNNRYETLKYLMLNHKNRLLEGIGEGRAYHLTLKGHIEKCVVDDNVIMLYILLAFSEYDLPQPIVDDLISDAIQCESVNVFKMLLDNFDHTDVVISKRTNRPHRHKMAIISDHHRINTFLRQGKKMVNGRVVYITR